MCVALNLRTKCIGLSVDDAEDRIGSLLADRVIVTTVAVTFNTAYLTSSETIAV